MGGTQLGWYSQEACLQGLVVFGPNKGREITFVKRKEWLPGVADLPVEEAEAMLLRRYLHGYGPASLADFAAWAGMTLSDAMPIKERAGSDTIEVKVEDKTCFVLKEDLKLLQDTEAFDLEEESVCMLPSFDCYMLGHRDKSHIVDQTYYKLVYRKAGWLSPVVLVNGRAEGIWNCRKKGNQLQVTIQLFGKVSEDAKKQIEDEVADLARFNEAHYHVLFSRLR